MLKSNKIKVFWHLQDVNQIQKKPKRSTPPVGQHKPCRRNPVGSPGPPTHLPHGDRCRRRPKKTSSNSASKRYSTKSRRRIDLILLVSFRDTELRPNPFQNRENMIFSLYCPIQNFTYLFKIYLIVFLLKLRNYGMKINIFPPSNVGGPSGPPNRPA